MRMPKIVIFLLFSNFPFSYQDSNQKVLMSDMLTTTSELIPTANVYSRHRILYKSTHAGNRDMFAVLNLFHARAPGSPGAGSGQFLVTFLRMRIRNLLPGAPESDLTISEQCCIKNIKEFAPGSPGAGSGNVL